MLEKQAMEQLVGVDDKESATMLGTIVLPRNLKVLTDRLPKANYNKTPMHKTPMHRSPSIGALEKHEVIEESKIPRFQPRRYSIERAEEGDYQGRQRYGNPIIQGKGELNKDLPSKVP